MASGFITEDEAALRDVTPNRTEFLESLSDLELAEEQRRRAERTVVVADDEVDEFVAKLEQMIEVAASSGRPFRVNVSQERNRDGKRVVRIDGTDLTPATSGFLLSSIDAIRGRRDAEEAQIDGGGMTPFGLSEVPDRFAASDRGHDSKIPDSHDLGEESQDPDQH